MKRKTIILAVVAAALVLCMGIAPAMAYFTDHHTADGGLEIYVEPTTEVHEWYGDTYKEVAITNSADAKVPVFVRVRAYSSLQVDISGDGWSGPDADGWYYYGSSMDDAGLTSLAPGETTSRLKAAITHKAQDESELDDNYNVIVVYESTPVQYKSDGSQFADWDYILDDGEE